MVSNKIGRTVSGVCIAFLAVLSIGTDTMAAWVNSTGSLAGQATECGDLQSIWAVPNTNKVITGVSGNGLWSTADGGSTWSKMGGTSGNAITIRLTQMIFDPASANTWWVCGIYHTPGVFKTTDAGTTWSALGNTMHHDGFSVDLSDPQRKLLLAGAHEASNTLWKSTDGGQNWTNIGAPGAGYSSYPYIINTQTWLMGAGSSGIYRTSDAGAHWSQVCTQAANSCVTKTSAGDLYYAGAGKVVKGTADGTSWTVLSNVASYAAAPIEIPGGKIAVMNANGISISADKGQTWTTGAKPMPAAITGDIRATTSCIGLAYNSVAHAFYTFHWYCSFTNPVTVGTDNVWRFDTTIAGETSVVKRANGATPLLNGNSRIALFDVRGCRVERFSTAQVSKPTDGVYFARGNDGTAHRWLGR